MHQEKIGYFINNTVKAERSLQILQKKIYMMYFVTSENRDILIMRKSPKEKLNFILHALWKTFDTHKITSIYKDIQFNGATASNQTCQRETNLQCLTYM